MCATANIIAANGGANNWGGYNSVAHYISDLNLGGLNDWWLPNQAEAQTIAFLNLAGTGFFPQTAYNHVDAGGGPSVGFSGSIDVIFVS